MDAAADALTLLDWKRRVFALYAEVRAAADPAAAWRRWRDARDDLFREHPQSPLPPDSRAGFAGLDYYDYDPALRFEAELRPLDAAVVRIGASTGEPVVFRAFAVASFDLGDLPVHWLDAYGGGVFLSFRDATSGAETYGGGRYLLDTVKGADLGDHDGRLVLDLNFAYNPSCAYDPRWSCPLAPPESVLADAVRAGERQAVPTRS